MKVWFLLNFSIMVPLLTLSQNLDTHRWENRLLLILHENNSSHLYQQQMDAFSKASKGMKERKLLVYSLSKERYHIGWGEDRQIFKGRKAYDRFKRKGRDFEVILVGLDGGVKLRKNEFLNIQELFDTIDAMPMRLTEMRRKGSQ